MPAPRSAMLIAAFLAMALLVPVGAPRASLSAGIAAQRSERDPVEDLRRQASQARVDLENATKQWESRREQLARSQHTLRATLRELGKADAELEQMREPLARLANASYQHKGAAGSMVVFGSGTLDIGLRTAADVGYLASAQDALVQRTTEVRQRREQLASTAQHLQSSNAVEQTKLRQTIETLRQRSTRLTRQLTETLNQMQADRDRRLVRGCDQDLVSDARRYPNGLIPSRYLCALPQQGEQLRADAALAFYKLNAAYKKRFGSDMCVRDSYRSLAGQQSIYYRRPGFAAIPGRSNHGLGTALDFCGGVQNQGSIQFMWLRANSQRYAWFHPAWAYSSPFEPWHWEYDEQSG